MENKLILICTNENEPTTDLVCDWLIKLKKSFVRISSFDLIKIQNVKVSNNLIDIEFSVKNNNYKLSDFSSYWYRRSKLMFEPIDNIKKSFDEIDSDILNFLIQEEFSSLKIYFESKLNEKSKLNIFENNTLNKLDVLSKAVECGLQIPSTIIASEKTHLDFIKDEKLITKAIGDICCDDKAFSYNLMTHKILINEIENDSFFYTLFQTQIEKKFELRIFFLECEFYSSAIFSQSSDKTKVDFRNYDMDNPNRVIPFILPNSIKEKLLNLMNSLSLKSGSIDMAYTTNNEFILFEINPVGQFEQVSNPCNYSLHKKIAELL